MLQDRPLIYLYHAVTRAGLAKQLHGREAVPGHAAPGRVRAVQVAAGRLDAIDDGRLPSPKVGSRPRRPRAREHARLPRRARDPRRPGDRARRGEPRPGRARGGPPQVPARPAAARAVRALDLARRCTATSAVDQRELSVAHTIVTRIPITLELALLSMFVAILVGIPAGVIAAVRRGKASDYIGDDRRARRPVRAALLARAADDHLVRRRPPLAPRERLRDDAPSDREPRAHDHAGDRRSAPGWRRS